MKLILFLFAALTSIPALASVSLTCSSGSLGDDTFVQVVFNKVGLVIDLHETHLVARGNEVIARGTTRAIVNRKLLVSAEGDQQLTKVDALILVDPKAKTAEMTLYFDGRLARTQALVCK